MGGQLASAGHEAWPLVTHLSCQLLQVREMEYTKELVGLLLLLLLLFFEICSTGVCFEQNN